MRLTEAVLMPTQIQAQQQMPFSARHFAGKAGSSAAGGESAALTGLLTACMHASAPGQGMRQGRWLQLRPQDVSIPLSHRVSHLCCHGPGRRHSARS